MPKEQKQNKQSVSPVSQNRLSFTWILLGIAAIILMWLLSSWIF